MKKLLFITLISAGLFISGCAKTEKTDEPDFKDRQPASYQEEEEDIMPDVSEAAQIPADWLSYVNTNNFTLQYPADWWKQESIGGVTLANYDTAYYEQQEVLEKGEIIENPIRIRILITQISPPYTSAVDEIEALSQLYIDQFRRDSLGEYAVWVREDEGGGRTTYIPRGEYYVEILTSKEVAEKNPVVDQIISTFRFTNTQ
ncbi:hypothetical protein JXD20_04975 [Candidatus Peregrinibacteria bacterium]|nr:hypothetical protein [Candidatus Peregrinibacteria bacterium]